MDYPFRVPLTVPAKSYAVAVPPDPERLLDCTMGVNPYGYPPAAGVSLQNISRLKQIKALPFQILT